MCYFLDILVFSLANLSLYAKYATHLINIFSPTGLFCFYHSNQRGIDTVLDQYSSDLTISSSALHFFTSISIHVYLHLFCLHLLYLDFFFKGENGRFIH